MEEAVQRSGRNQFLRILLYTFVIGLFAHGYCMFNGNFTHDALAGLYYEASDATYISNGRYLRPLYFLLRGHWALPAVNIGLMLLYLAAAVFLIVRLLRLQKPMLCLVLCGVLVTNCSISLLNASYLHDADTYGLAFLLSVLGVWLTRTFPGRGRPAALLVWFASLGLYQAYIQAAILLLFLLTAAAPLEDSQRPLSAALRPLFADLLTIAGAMVLYYIGFRLAPMVSGLQQAELYNSPSQVTQLSAWALLRNVWHAVYAELRFFFFPAAQNTWVCAAVNLGLIGYTAACLIRLVRRKHITGKRLACIALLLAAMLPGMGCILMLSGIYHELLTFPFCLTILLPLWLAEQVAPEEDPRSLLQPIAAALCAVLILDGCLYANTLYLKKDMECRATLSLCTRLLDRIEQTEGYCPGQTPVAIIGSISDSSLSLPRQDMDDRNVGLWNPYAITNYNAYAPYFEVYLGYPLNLVSEEAVIAWEQDPEVTAMPAFPAANCCRMIGDTLVIRVV